MDLQPWYLLYLIAVVMATCPGEAKKVCTSGTRNGGARCISPWQFMSSSNIYLIKSNMSYKGITCIKARTLEKDPEKQTLSHVVSFYVNASQTWLAMNATYNPLKTHTTGRAKAFTSVYNGETTNYTFSLLGTYYAIVRKEKGSSSEDLRNSCELWVNDKYFNRNCTAKKERCEKKFRTICGPNPEISYDCYNCNQPKRGDN
uniref:Putative lipocalin n=1 Tax=Amblyomma cajennense TaxID=34607 RepID=A0A023FU43_AMBCJ